MGIIRAATGSIGGALADQWLEVIQADNMGGSTVMTTGVAVRRNDKRNQNKKGSVDVISDGSIVQVAENQFMLLTDGGKVVDYSGEAGYFQVKNQNAPSLFNGDFGEAVENTFERVKFGGVTPFSQKVYFINTQEISNIAFGTVNPINYFDDFYNAELYLRCHGYFSIRIVDPLKFYTEAIPRNASRVNVEDINKLYLAEFLTALQASIGKMSVDGIRISHVTSKSRELASYLSTTLDEDWTQKRGMIIESVGISSISYDDASKKLIDMRNQGAMLSDPTIREGYVQGSVARGIEAAGSNKAGSMAGFMGVGMGMQAGGGFMGAASSSNQAQMERDAANKPQPAPASPNQAAGAWTCSCGATASGNFCSGCGGKKPEAPKAAFCSNCGTTLPPGAKFCSSCGHKL